jgi:hypothetical protein
MTEYGTESTTYKIGNAQITKISKFRKGEETICLKHYRTRVKVNSSQDEMTEFIKFTDELAKYREQEKLVVDKDDSSTTPAFEFDFPKENRDGSYFIVKRFTILV